MLEKPVYSDIINNFYLRLAQEDASYKNASEHDLFKNLQVSENMKEIVRAHDAKGDDPEDKLIEDISIYIEDADGTGSRTVTLTSDMLYAIRAAIKAEDEAAAIKKTQHSLTTTQTEEQTLTNAMLRRFTKQGFRVYDYRDFNILPYSCLDTINRLGDKTLGKRINVKNNMEDIIVTVNKAIIYTARQAIDWLFTQYKTKDLEQAVESALQDNSYFAFSKLTKKAQIEELTSFYNFYIDQIKCAMYEKNSSAEDDNSALLKSFDEERYPGEFVEFSAKSIFPYFKRFQNYINSKEQPKMIDIQAVHSLLVDRCQEVIDYSNSAMSNFYNNNSMNEKLASYGYSIGDKLDSSNITLPSDSLAYGIQCDTSKECFNNFVSNPTKESFNLLINTISAELGEGDTFGRDVTSEILSLAEREGASWITQENVKFLYELYNV